MTLKFKTWSGINGIEQYINNITNCKAFSGVGICHRADKKITILRSVDNTYYYDDNLNNINNPIYTLFGHNNDQKEDEKRFNEPLLNKDKTKHIYLYRVLNNKNYKYEWYGEYKIIKKSKKNHIGKDYNYRNIILLHLEKI